MGGLDLPFLLVTMEDINENVKNLYVIRRKLAELRPRNNTVYEYDVGNFAIHIFPFEIQDGGQVLADTILKYKTVNITLWEINKNKVESIIRLTTDPRFKDYEPIIYDSFRSPNGLINFSNGDKMPIHHLCELIKYLHRLSNLTAFM